MKLSKLRASGVPLAFYETTDPGAKLVELRKGLNGKSSDYAILQFDVVQGIIGLNETGRNWVKVNGPEEGFTFTLNDWILRLIDQRCLTDKPGLVFWHHPEFEVPTIRQGVWLMRDAFKTNKWTWIGLGVTANLPPQLSQDIAVIPESLPDAKELGLMVNDVCTAARKAGANIEGPAENEAAQALLGLNSFSAEQALALSVSIAGIDMPSLWQRKISTIKNSSGCEVTINNPDFSSVAGLNNIKAFLQDYLKGRRPPGIVVLMDELEKGFAGSGTDLSGVTTKMEGIFLSFTEDNDVDGIILNGIPGAGKSAIAKAVSGAARVPLFHLSLAKLQNSLVGQSEANLVMAFNMIKAISGGRIFVIGTSNATANLSDAILGRFSLDTPYFFDYPNEEEAEAIWKLYIKQWSLPDPVPAPSMARNWVGREIKKACYKAWCLNRPLEDVVRTFIPQAIYRKAALEDVRTKASGRYLSATYPGAFQADRVEAEKKTGRVLNF